MAEENNEVLGWDACDWDSLSKNQSLLLGSWEWQSSIYGEVPPGSSGIITPDSVGYSESLVFSDGGFVETWRDGELLESRSYEVKPYGRGLRSNELWLYIDGRESMFGVSQEKLCISTAFVDGPQSVYKNSD